MRLPLLVIPEADESLVGLLVRLTERNGIDKPQSLAGIVGISHQPLSLAATRRFNLIPLSTASKIAPSTLENLTYWPSRDGSTSNFLGHQLNSRYIAPKPRRACPQCLAQKPYHRAAWDLTVVTVCPDHAVRLIGTCHHCDRDLDWSVSSVTAFSCGADIRKAVAEPIARHELDGIRHVYDLLDLPHEQQKAPPVLPLDLNETLELLITLGWYGANPGGRIRPSKQPAVDPDMHRILQFGHRALSDWPRSLFRYLDQIIYEATKPRLLVGNHVVRAHKRGLTRP